MSDNLYANLGTSQRILKLLKSQKDFGGPQSIEDVCTNLKMTNRNARSILSKMTIRGEIDRIGQGIYRAKNDEREFDPKKPHYS